MTRHPARTAARVLTALLGTGALTAALAACGGPGDGGDTSAPAGPPAASSGAAGTTPATPSPSDAPASGPASASSASSGATSASGTASSGTASASGTADARTGREERVEAALVAVLGDEAQIVRGEQFEQIASSAQGLGEGMTVTPEECGQDGVGGQTGRLPEDTDVIGGILLDTQDPASPASDMLSVTTFPDEAAAAEALAAYADFAEQCPEYTVAMDDGITADATVDSEDVPADADEALAVTVGVAVDIEGVELPAGTESTTTTSLYVRDGERLVSYAGSVAGDEPVPLEDGLELVDALRAELDG